MKRGRREGAKLAQCECGARFVTYPHNDPKTCKECGRAFTPAVLSRIYAGHSVHGARLVATRGN